MGRIEKSQGLAPPAVRKDIRAKQAKQVINKTIPALLASISRASKGVESSELIVNPPSSIASADASGKRDADPQEDAYIKRKGQGRRKVKVETGFDSLTNTSKPKGRKGHNSTDLDLNTLSLTSPSSPPALLPACKISKIRVITTNTLTAAHILGHPPSRPSKPDQKASKKSPNVCILNMASPLRPGGGVLTGATSQEEFLCARTTLLPSLQESYYRLPEIGGIWSPDILVFHDHSPLGDAKGELGPSERYWIDVISAGMLRFPELEGGEDETKRLSKRDRAVVEKKMRAVLRIAVQKGVRKLVLGAWGCGAYGNPVVDIAQAWKNVLCAPANSGNKKNRSEVESWPGLEEVIFAISNHRMAADFANAFDKSTVVEPGPTDEAESEEDDEGEDKVAEELRAKILEMEGQVSKVWNPDLKARMGVILEGLRTQLREREGEAGEDESSAGGAQLTPEDSEIEEDYGGEQVDSGEDDEVEETEGLRI
jgi:uncharacterized protein (TIGR02452 family)